MLSIFYDLETSDRHFCGQILNYAFIAVDDNYKVVDECCGDIKISPLQLPVPSAIAANGINVIEHQKLAKLSEPEALTHIATFLSQMITRAKGAVTLIGYNTPRFDLPYLRTSFIRNGMNPYFGGKLIYKDVLAVARYLSCTQKEFPRIPAQEEDRKGRLSLRLETLAKHFGLLSGKQAHASRDDTLLTIALAKKFLANWEIDVRTFDTYQGDKLAAKPRAGKVFVMFEPQYDLESPDIASNIPVTLLDQDRRYALWINLVDYKNEKGRRSVFFATKATASFFSNGTENNDDAIGKTCQRALDEFANINLSNFFERSSCDIEQDIYRIGMDEIEALRQAIWEHNEKAIKALSTRDAWVLYKRFQLANATAQEQGTAEYQEMFKKYANYRYGGAMKMDKFQSDPPEKAENCHPKFAQLLEELQALLNTNSERREQLLGLMEFYNRSPISLIAK